MTTETMPIGYRASGQAKLQVLALWQLQRLAAKDSDSPNSEARDAVVELARRNAAAERGHATVDGKYWYRIVGQFMRGFDGASDEYGGGKGGNFARPLRRAHRKGKELRELIGTIRAEG